jgi:uncharacterized protein YcfJ
MKYQLKSKLLLSVVCVSLTLQGCAIAPRGAAYVPMVDMQGHTDESFRSDLYECQTYANKKASAGQAAIAGAIFGALLGAALGARGYRNETAAYGAAAGGGAMAERANETQEMVIKRCLAGRGYNILD